MAFVKIPGEIAGNRGFALRQRVQVAIPHFRGDFVAEVQQLPEVWIEGRILRVVAKCGGCHQQDAKGNMTRISWERTTPEGWELALKRMIRLNGVVLTTAEARAWLSS